MYVCMYIRKTQVQFKGCIFILKSMSMSMFMYYVPLSVMRAWVDA